MLMRTFKITFTATSKNITEILGLLVSEIQDLHVSEVLPEKTTFPMRKSPKNISRKSHLMDTVRKVLSDGKAHEISEFYPALSGVGLSPNSASPAVSKLVAKGEVIRVASRTYKKAA
jgi:hypothetical protein